LTSSDRRKAHWKHLEPDGGKKTYAPDPKPVKKPKPSKGGKK
jgi:hypothetical protein